MNTKLIHWLSPTVLSVLSLAHASTLAPADSQLPGQDEAAVNVIFDTDIWSDIDDAFALAMLHALEDRGEIKLLAVTISMNDRWCASYVDLLNSFYGHPDVPIGVNRNGMDVEFFRKRFPQGQWPSTRYTQLVVEQDKGTWLSPHHLTKWNSRPDAVALLRKTLAAQRDASVVVIQVGYSTNLARLLRSPPDAISSLNGRELLARKVRLLSVMAGSFGDATVGGVNGKEIPIPKGSPEFNLAADTSSAEALFANWPTPIVASGVEIGGNLPLQPESIEHDYSYTRDHPIVKSYRIFCEELKSRFPQLTTCPHAHPTFDLTSVLYAARPDRDYFSLSNAGKIVVMDDGSSRFDEVPGGRDRYLILHEEQKRRTLEAMMMLASQPPSYNAKP